VRRNFGWQKDSCNMSLLSLKCNPTTFILESVPEYFPSQVRQMTPLLPISAKIVSIFRGPENNFIIGCGIEIFYHTAHSYYDSCEKRSF